jgi:hypothetical protein
VCLSRAWQGGLEPSLTRLEFGRVVITGSKPASDGFCLQREVT